MPYRTLLVLVSALVLPLAAPARLAHADESWQWPLAGPHQVVRAFDPPAHDWLPGNRGVDLAATPGSRVLAAGAGTVSFAGRVGRIGVVAVRHPGGLETTYEPVQAGVRAGAGGMAGAPRGLGGGPGGPPPPRRGVD